MSSPRNKAGKPAGDVPELLELGAELGARRRTLGRLQQDVATAAGVSRSTLHTIEHGGAGVRWEKVAAVAKSLGLRMSFEPLDATEGDVGDAAGEFDN
ncbi:helix-turn-helix domain-containing protein [Corynebacterium halotolerans]|uniref:HTH cro/C1-type domain-containing protein n=1 Tax=Corynebacterium halotolerans YIM 70093 = DSM 44683 TaxID=1121362 RepID=M1NJ63_9CORY|nr:helix-turn-helix domain-containing protein [Corynebacterium halotolerans]AGF71443.1 hypothetical protein A605_02145 [Corynebacterium halotolerans YIM 70093 = DSM 44683]